MCYEILSLLECCDVILCQTKNGGSCL
uniref:Uncharacterized protein n=1 Tax=Rhizophora mucronata TaxID=61149 RepID=A0A2P2NUF9_RHIMU